ncbi:galactose oxidase precursor [Lasiosphaeria hispida]|uniref:Galactose oxidase n=1 Tax=Lasiosphaeria hispida TaxID=260671 RepID=A0AAJ0MA52_9PEZI|nr:galactose oxidase precursor [Lasiosphaeria hispida]
MFNLRRFFYEAVALSEPDATSDSENLLLASNDAEKTRLPSPPRPQTTLGKLRQLPFVAKVLFLTSVFAFTIFFGQPIANFAALAYNVVLQCGKAHHQTPEVLEGGVLEPVAVRPAAPWHDGVPLVGQGATVTEPVLPAATPWGATRIEDRTGWKATCSSNQADSTTGCDKAIDARGVETDWKSATNPGAVHWIVIDLGREVIIHSLAVAPSQSSEDEGAVRKHRVEVREATGEWQLVALGAWRDSGGAAIFEPRLARFVNLSVVDTHGDAGFVAISDINVWTLPAIPGAVDRGGRWSHTLDFPLVPVTAWLNPKTGRLVTVASYAYNHFQANNKERKTVLAEWDPASGNITEQTIDKTHHDVFCPGTSMDEVGQVIFTGGSTADVFSIYNPDSGWGMPANNKVNKSRGYQGQTYLPDGRTFMIGGTWPDDSDVDKDGEIYDPKTGDWTLLKGKIPADAIRMDKSQCEPWSDAGGCVKDQWRQHHPWLFAWKDGSVFHAGPSKKMNWFFLTKGSERVEEGGLRQDASNKSNIFADGDAVCGAAVMYDAVSGSILTAGGAPNYHYWLNPESRDRHRLNSTNNVFNITLGTPGHVVEPTRLASMKHSRIFANTAILPNGEIFVVGGQTQGEPFYDETWLAIPEIYTPKTNEWRDAANHSIPRAYHSWALLLPDASVLVGGGGLNKDHEKTNHYDAQIYQPDYTTPDGKTTVERPTITNNHASIEEYQLGPSLKIPILTDVEVDDASLIRYSATTHSLNNDLRRIHLALVPQGNAADRNYTAEIPGDAGVTLPGYWMLFVLRKGVPSHAKTIRIYK